MTSFGQNMIKNHRQAKRFHIENVAPTHAISRHCTELTLFLCATSLPSGDFNRLLSRWRNHAGLRGHSASPRLMSYSSQRQQRGSKLPDIMMTSSNLNIFLTGHLCGELPAQSPVKQSFYVFFDLRLNKRLSQQLWGWWFETPSCPLWRHCNICSRL